MSWLDSVRPETLIVGPTAPLATAGVVTDGSATALAADGIGIRPALPPKAPAGAATGVTAAAFPVGTLRVSLSELARPGSGASDEAETGAPTMGTAAPAVVWDEGRGWSEVTEEAWPAPPWLGSGASDEEAARFPPEVGSGASDEAAGWLVGSGASDEAAG